MAQKIKQGNLFGRIGSGIGKGLAEQLPKEIERGRLASGLKQFEQASANLNPIQQLARLSAIPGITPQMIQSFHELAKYQNQGNAFKRSAGQAPGTSGSRPEEKPAASPEMERNLGELALRGAVQGGQPAQMPAAALPATGQVDNKQATPNVPPDQRGVPQIQNEPPLADRTLARPPWTPDMRNQRISEYIDQGFLADQAKQLAADDEARDLATPEAYEKRQNQLTKKSEDARAEFQRQLQTKLQKTGENVFKDVTGEMIANAERGLERDLRTNPNLTFREAANDWSNRLLNVAKAKDQLNKLGATTGLESILKGDQTLKKLKSYQDIFKRAGNAEEYSNILREKFGLSPQGSALIAYPLTKPLKQYVDNYKPINPVFGVYGGVPDYAKMRDNSRKAAIEIEKHLDADDSLLAIARALNEKDPSFNQEAFFEQLQEDADNIRLNDRQRREMAEGVKDILPTWGDIKIFPWFRRTP